MTNRLSRCFRIIIRFSTGLTFRQRFLRETHTWSKLKHKNVHPLRGITTRIDFSVSIVSEWMKNGNAYDYVQNIEIDPRILIRGIASGLQYLHNRKEGMVVHGDMKGVNVLVSNEGEALLTDFGLSCLTNSSFTMTASTPKGGALRWCAPELLDDADPSAKADIWAFGMTALELFTRREPYQGLRNSAAVTSHISRGKIPVRPGKVDTHSRMTDQWWDMMCWCWKLDPKARPNISGIVERIQHIVCALIEIVVLNCLPNIQVMNPGQT
ncbi:hypothetical protein ID866_8821 [Astraeus odoratus]|nr:hypothetical protein ID866_8821 [Astraeus odoratus]